MTVIGVRQLRQNASVYLRLVEAGETIQIADRGRPVALWVPIPTRRGAIAKLDRVWLRIHKVGVERPTTAAFTPPSAVLIESESDAEANLWREIREVLATR